MIEPGLLTFVDCLINGPGIRSSARERVVQLMNVIPARHPLGGHLSQSRRILLGDYGLEDENEADILRVCS